MQLVDENRWYNFDDSHVASIDEDEVKTAAAYVLFYRRVREQDRARGTSNGSQLYAKRSHGYSHR
jgi:ubiquitin carboxyl-terminal hydrolase 4/11/15